MKSVTSWRQWFTAACCAAVLAVMTGCGGAGGDKAESAAQQLHVGTNATYVPFEFKNKDDQYDGFDMELAQAVAKKMGKDCVIHNISFDGLIPAVMTGEIQTVFSGMVITPEREEKVDFVPYYKTGLGILVSEKTTTIHSKEDLVGKKIAVQMGTTGSVEAHKIPDAQIREFDHNSEALLELAQGGVDAVICAIPVAKHYLATSGKGEQLIAEPLQRQTLGLAVKKGDKQLYQEVEKALLAVKEDGTYDKLYEKWFGETSPAQWR